VAPCFLHASGTASAGRVPAPPADRHLNQKIGDDGTLFFTCFSFPAPVRWRSSPAGQFDITKITPNVFPKPTDFQKESRTKTHEYVRFCVSRSLLVALLHCEVCGSCDLDSVRFWSTWVCMCVRSWTPFFRQGAGLTALTKFPKNGEHSVLHFLYCGVYEIRLSSAQYRVNGEHSALHFIHFGV
jgi:hypothetical protein